MPLGYSVSSSTTFRASATRARLVDRSAGHAASGRGDAHRRRRLAAQRPRAAGATTRRWRSTRTTTARSGTRTSTTTTTGGATGARGSARSGSRTAARRHLRLRRLHRRRRHRRRRLSTTSTTTRPARPSRSQNFEAGFDAYDSELADDFIVPSGAPWTVGGRRRRGHVLQRRRAGGVVNVRFFSNGSGNLPGTLVAERLAQSYAGETGTSTSTSALRRSRDRHVLGLRAGEPGLRPERPVGLDDPLRAVGERRGLQERRRRVRTRALHDLDAKR